MSDPMVEAQQIKEAVAVWVKDTNIYKDFVEVERLRQQLELDGLAQDLCDKVDVAMQGVRLEGESLDECALRLRQRVEELTEKLNRTMSVTSLTRRAQAAEKRVEELERDEAVTHLGRYGRDVVRENAALRQRAAAAEAEGERLRAALEDIIANGHERVENRAGDMYCVEACAVCVAEAALAPANPADDPAADLQAMGAPAQPCKRCDGCGLVPDGLPCDGPIIHVEVEA